MGMVVVLVLGLVVVGVRKFFAPWRSCGVVAMVMVVVVVVVVV